MCAGIDNGATLKMPGLGGQVPREFGGHGEPGDLLLQVSRLQACFVLRYSSYFLGQTAGPMQPSCAAVVAAVPSCGACCACNARLCKTLPHRPLCQHAV